LRRFVWLAFIWTFFLLASFAHAQQLDFAVGGNTLWSPKNTTASGGFIAPAEKGGVYPSVFLQYITDKNHFGFNAEGSFRYYQAYYNYYQPYRPILYDVNAVYTNRLAPKTHGDFMAGIGGETVIFDNASGGCPIPSGGCRAYVNATHLLFHAGVGIRYYVWRNFFLRPEAHYYIIPNNYEFHSGNVFRVGASVGYTWGTH